MVPPVKELITPVSCLVQEDMLMTTQCAMDSSEHTDDQTYINRHQKLEEQELTKHYGLAAVGLSTTLEKVQSEKRVAAHEEGSVSPSRKSTSEDGGRPSSSLMVRIELGGSPFAME